MRKTSFISEFSVFPVIFVLTVLLVLLSGCGITDNRADSSNTSNSAGLSGQGLHTFSDSATNTAGNSTASAGSRASDDPVLQKFSGTIYDCFDTITVVTAYCEKEEDFNVLMERIKSELTEYHQLYDIYRSYEGMTNLHDVNERAGAAAVEVPEKLRDLLLFAKEMYTLTEGNMNVAFGAVLKLWHEAREYSIANPGSAYIPEQTVLKAAAEHCSIDDVIVDEVAGTVFFADPELSLDVGAVAKGYSVERIARGLISDGYDHILINAGGNVRAIGSKPGGQDWVVGITNPDTSSPEPYIQTLSVSDKAVVTSGDYQRYYTVDGVTYHHIISTDTLMPARYYRSVTVITGDSGRADALSTALFNMDPAAGKALADSLGDVETIRVE